MSQSAQQRAKIEKNTRRMSGQLATSIGSRRNSNSSGKLSSGTVTSISDNDKRSNDDCNVKVAVRCRPISEREIADGHQSIVEFEGNKRIVVHDLSESPGDQLGAGDYGDRRRYSHIYDFDYVFNCASTQQEVYDNVCRQIVDSVLEGYNGTIFAYGQTGTGKTYTMEGESMLGRQPKNRNNAKTRRDQMANTESPSRKQSTIEENALGGQSSSSKLQETRNNVVEQQQLQSAGIIPRAFEQIFQHVAANPKVQFLIRASYLEIYQEDIHDLLTKDRSVKLELHERPDTGVYVKNLTSFVCKSITEIDRVMRVGNQNRMVGATDMNERSSRSHAIFTITVEQQTVSAILPEGGTEANTSNDKTSQKRTTSGSDRKDLLEDSRQVIKVGKLNLVDLAGSERQRKTNSFGQRQLESIKINLSLSALGNVINSLMKIHSEQQQSNKQTTKVQFTPYRDSKLTRLLQDSLGGNAKTLMIANIGPANYNYDETINTLNYASRAKCIRNKPRLNEDPKDALLRELQREINELKSKVAATMAANNNGNEHNKSKLKTSKKRDTNVLIDGVQIERGEDYQKTKPIVKKELIELKQRLSSLESKLLNGKIANVDAINPSILMGYTKEQAIQLERRFAELANQKDKEQAIKDELEKGEDTELLVRQSFNSVRQEVDAKKRLIMQVLAKVKSLRDEIDDTQKAYRQELDELDQLQYVLQKELKLKCLIMDNFIPNSHVDQVLPRIVFNDRSNCCLLRPIELPLDYCIVNPNSDQSKLEDFWRPTYDSIRPKSEMERISEAIYPSNIRYKYEELIEPKLELMPPGQERKLGPGPQAVSDEEHQKLKFSSHLQMLIDQALNQRESDVVL